MSIEKNLKVFIPALLPELPVLEILWPVFGQPEWEKSRWSAQAFSNLKSLPFSIVEKPDQADVFLLPYNWQVIHNNIGYWTALRDLAAVYQKKILVFVPGDSDEIISWPEAIIFRHSSYRRTKLPNEIILPGYVQDLGESEGIVYQYLKNTIPVIGFCGWATFPSFRFTVRFYVKMLYKITLITLGLDRMVRIQGLWWRIRAIRILHTSKLVGTSFIVRSSYSGNEKTISLDKDQARKEYIDNIKNTNFSLCIRGDGNFSTRFFEVLSLGRIPILLDTDCVLPLETEINYNDFILRINYRKLGEIDRIIRHYYDNLHPDQIVEKQKQARTIFEGYLRADKFFSKVLTREYLKI